MKLLALTCEDLEPVWILSQGCFESARNYLAFLWRSGFLSRVLKTALILALSAVLLSGCMGIFTKVNRFTTLPPEPIPGTTFAFKDGTKNLEDATYRALIVKELEKKGWVQTGAKSAQYLVDYGYSIDGGTAVQQNHSMMGQISGGTSMTSGTVYTPGGGMATYQGSTWSPPVYGEVGSYSTTHTIFHRQFDVNIYKKSSGEMVFQASAQSNGRISELSTVLPRMIQTMFDVFPGKNASRNTSYL